MAVLVKPSGPPSATRPFAPDQFEKDPAERIAHALEHIAVSLAALDHNVEALVRLTRTGQQQP
jgi:hypothetical protein